MTLRAMWPIVDTRVSLRALIAEASGDLPAVAARHGVRPAGPVTGWAVRRSVDVPGSGRVTERVLVCEVPVRRVRGRAYRGAA